MSDALVGIVVVTHGHSGHEMVATVTRLLGAACTDGLAAVDVPASETRPVVASLIRDAVAGVDKGGGVVVACDLHGSTPSNCAIELIEEGRVAVVCGVNLAMVVKLASAARAGATPEAVAKAAVDTALRSIMVEKGNVEARGKP